MQKPIIEMTFREVDGIWRRVDSQETLPPTLADVLNELNIIVDDRTQFARIYDYDKDLCIYYRTYGGKITITIWNIGNET